MYKRRRDMVPGDVYYWEPIDDDSVCLLYQVLNQDTEVYLGNVHGAHTEFTPSLCADGLFIPYRIFELVEEESGTTE